jgi:hypothetical protein
MASRFRRHLAGWLAILALCAWSGAARTGGTAVVEKLAKSSQTADARFRQGLLWQVEARDGGRPSYLFGTLHWDDERVLKVPPEVNRAFERSTRFAPELLMDDDSVHRFRSAMVTQEPQLPIVLGEELYGRIEPLLVEHGIPRDLRPQLKPWAALLTLMQPRERPGIVLDNLLIIQAKQLNKSIAALESVEEQIAAFDEMPQETQLALLRKVEKNHVSIQDAVRPIAEAYIKRDLDAIWRLNHQAMTGAELDLHDRIFLDRVLFERNERMAQRLAARLSEGGVFAAFGALHLYGERGVPSLLEKRGFKLRRLY